MIPNATRQIVSHAGVQNVSTAIGHHINEERFHFDCEVPRRLRDSG